MSEQQRLNDLKADVEGKLIAAESSECSDQNIKECESAIKLAEMEIRTISPEQVGRTTIDEYKVWLRKCKARVQEAKRNLLLNTNGRNVSNSDREMRERQVHVTERMNKQNDTLNEARKALAETEQTANGIMYDLASQKETIRSTSEKAQQVNQDVGYSERLLKSMQTWWQFGSIQNKK